MELSGTLVGNLDSALKSARRLQGHPVHEDTLVFWQKLLAHARATKRGQPEEDMTAIESLIGQLQSELAARQA